jgi:hypothetical protein
MVLALSSRSPWRRHVGVAARLDERRSDGELVFQRVIGRDIFRVLAPLPEGPSTGICFPALVSPSPVSGPRAFAHLTLSELSRPRNAAA